MLELRLGVVARSAGRDLGNTIAMCDRQEFARDHMVGSLGYPFDAAIDADLPLEFPAHTRRSNAFSADHTVSSPICFVTRRRTGDYRDKSSTGGRLSGHPNQATARAANERMAASREARERLERQLCWREPRRCRAASDQLETIRGPLLKVCPRRNRSFTSIERPDQMCARHFVVKIRMRLSEAAVASGAVGGGIEAVAVECRRGREKNDCRAIRLKVGSLGNGRGSVVERPYAAPTAWSPDQ